jgi:hypothetical protein
MPKELHDELEARADKLIEKGELKKEDKDAYVFGTMDKIQKQHDAKEKRKKDKTVAKESLPLHARW